MDLLSNLNDDGHTFIIVTHNPENVKYVDRCIHLRDGRFLRDEISKTRIIGRKDIRTRRAGVDLKQT